MPVTGADRPPPDPAGLPYWRLAASYFGYFGALGAFLPYWGLYLQSRGFDALAVGQLMAVLGATKVPAPLLMGHWVDRVGRRMPLIRLAALGTLLSFGTVWLTGGFWGMVLATALFGCFWNAYLPQLDAVTFNHLGARTEYYARVRLWGSVGFILAVWLLGVHLEGAPLGAVPHWVLALFAATWIGTLLVPDSPPVREQGPAAALGRQLRRPEVLALLGACFLMQAGHAVYYAFYSIHLKAAGYAIGAVGQLWVLGVVAEVAVFTVMHRLLRRFGARRVLIASFALAAVRWVLIGAFAGLVAVQVFAQTLHAATFGTFHAAAIHLIHRYFPGATQGRGQALYGSLSFGASGAVGSLAGGLLWEDAGPLAAFGAATAAALLGLWAVWRWVEPERGG